MADIWSPRRLLGVDPDGPFTCVGMTQKGARCRNSFISNSDLAKASSLLDWMAMSDPWDAGAQLGYLAEITLCPRWHRKPGYSQVESMKRKWWSIIISTYPESRLTRQFTETNLDIEAPPIPRTTRQTSASVVSIPATRSLLTPPPSPSPAPRLRLVASTGHGVRTPSSRDRPINSPPLRTPTDSPIRSRASSSASVGPSTRSTATPVALITPPHSPRRAPTQTRNAIASTSLPAIAATSAASSSRTSRPTSQSQGRQPSNDWLLLTPERPIRPTPCAHSSRRKPLIDECPICNEDMHCLDDAVWCRAQCGTNMHRRCFAPWRRACLDRNAIVTCVYCRAPWKFEWED